MVYLVRTWPPVDEAVVAGARELQRWYLPACRRCGQHAAGPPEPGRGWYGPGNATLVCDICGHGWVANADELIQHAAAVDYWYGSEHKYTREACRLALPCIH